MSKVDNMSQEADDHDTMPDMLTVPEVARRFGVSAQTVRNWIASGRLPAVQATARGRFRIRSGALEAFERDAGLRRAGSPAGDEELDRVVRAIVDEVQPRAVVLFGSRARGDAGPGSDIDLALISPDQADRRRTAMRAYQAVARVHGRTAAVDIVVLTPSLLAAERDLAGSIVRAVVRDGVAVHGSVALA